MRVFDWVLNGLATLAALLLFLSIFIIAADVTARALFDESLTWTLEASEHGMLAILFLGMPWLAREKGHISVELFTEMMPSGARAVLARLMALVCVVLLGWLCLWAGRLAMNDYARGIMTIGIHPIPRFLLPTLVALGLALTSVEYLRQAITGGRDPGRTGDIAL